ncbi:MAG: hydrogenase iron-sulfur subunit [Candidatus Methanomethylicia archaeon]|nr:hydrogenase iron-sulfur subunit [Candidatus Methanomethylicia archaeon]MCX8169260.1 hydrogenase iron-sulfur subunit [Candidatus Methanomethylicia archaeon]MDW7988958.1 hydrogenase iron-sulfur subunit [Nitrososphaerota archaeon]
MEKISSQIVNSKSKIIGFMCKWCGYAAADLAGNLRKIYPTNLRIIRVACSGRIDTTHILRAFEIGADGVLIIGCHPGDCHYINGNYKAYVKVMFMKQLLKEFGLNPERLHIDWASAGEGERFSKIVSDFVDRINKIKKVSP